MGTHVFRVTVRGVFDGLTDESRTDLLATAGDHDNLDAAFTTDGTFTYDRALHAFSLRYEVRVDDEDDELDAVKDAVIESTIARAAAELTSAGIGHRALRATAADMADLWRRTGR